MQKKIIALAVAAVASGAAFAQSNVTISGNLNYQLENVQGSNPSDAINKTPAQLTSREGRARLNENGSELRFAATEDLGNGLKAVASIGVGIDPNNSHYANASGNGRSIIGGRNTYVGLAGAWGTVIGGKHDVHYHTQTALGVDDFSSKAGAATSSLAILNGVGGAAQNLNAAGSTLAGYGAAAGGRLSNTVAYITPTVSGFHALFGYARPNAGAVANTVGGMATSSIDGVVNTSGTTQRKESGWTVLGVYDNGPIKAFGSYLAHNDIALNNVGSVGTAGGLLFQDRTNRTVFSTAGTVASGGLNSTLAGFSGEVRGFRTGASYALPMGLKIGLVYDNTKFLARSDAAAAGVLSDYTAKRTAWVIPVQWAFGPHNIGASYGKAGNVTIGGTISTVVAGLNTNAQGGADMNNTGARYFMAGYQYAFSKRTNLSLAYSRIDNDSRAAYDFFSSGAMGITANQRGSDPTSVAIGLKHSF